MSAFWRHFTSAPDDFSVSALAKEHEEDVVVVVVEPLEEEVPFSAASTFAIVALSAPNEERSESIADTCVLERPEDEVVVVGGIVVTLPTLPLDELPLLPDEDEFELELELEELLLLLPPLLPLPPPQLAVATEPCAVFQTLPPASLVSTK